MFDNLGWPEILALLLIARFVLGPERLPKIMADIGGMIRKVRRMATAATADLNKDLGTDLDISDLNPKAFIRKHVLSEEDENALKRPLQAAFEDLKRDTEGVRNTLKDTADGMTSKVTGGGANKTNGSTPVTDDTPVTDPPNRTAKYDADAT